MTSSSTSARRMPDPIFTISGLRGIIGQNLTPELAARTAAAFGALIHGGPVALARDCRSSGTMLYAAAMSGLIGAGCRVLSLDICPTPTVPLLVAVEKLSGGVMITASHNPPEWNGMKLISTSGAALDESMLHQLKGMLRTDRFPRATWDRLGSVHERRDAIDLHIRRILDSAFFRGRRHRRLKVGIDACHGAASVAASRLVRAMGSTPFELYCSIEKGSCFPRGAEPMAEHLRDLGAFVLRNRLDLGVAFDPDGDRFSCVDENGSPLGEEASVVIATDYVLRQKPGPVVVNLSTTKAVDEVAARYQSPVTRSRVGEASVVAKMIEVKAVVGGEGNGGVIIPSINRARDGLVALAVLIQSLSDAGKRLSAFASQFPSYVMLKSKSPVAGGGWPATQRSLKAAFAGSRIDATDGLKIITETGWVHVRPSNTEPVVRIISEAGTLAECRRMERQVRSTLRKRS